MKANASDNVVVEPWNPRWSSAFESESRRLSDVLGHAAAAIHHIGSTAVPGLSAKPIIDVLIECPDLGAIDERRHALVEAGYDWKGEGGIAGRRYLVRRDPSSGTRLAHVHIFSRGNPEIEKHLDFRDLLRTNSAAMHLYAELKEHLADEFEFDRDRYTSGKNSLISALTEAPHGTIPDESQWLIPRVRSCVYCEHNASILLVRMKDPVTEVTYHFPPGGMVETGESLAAACVRETLEETGYRVVCEPTEAFHFDHLSVWAGKIYQCRTHLFRGRLADPASQPLPVHDASYNLGFEWVNKDRVLSLFTQSKSNHSAIERLLA